MSDLNATQLETLNAQLKTQYREIQHEVRAELENSGEQHRIDLLNREPGDSGDESLANALSDFNMAQFGRHIHALQDLESAVKRIGFRLDRVISKDKIGLAWFSKPT